MSDQDGSEPTPNSVSASNLHRLSCYMNRKLSPSAEHIYSTFREMLTKAPVALCGMLESFVWQSQTPTQVRAQQGYFLLREHLLGYLYNYQRVYIGIVEECTHITTAVELLEVSSWDKTLLEP